MRAWVDGAATARPPTGAGQGVTQLDGDRAHSGERQIGRIGGIDLAGHRVEHQGEQLVLVPDAVVQRHHLVAEAAGEGTHAEGVEPVGVGDGDGVTHRSPPWSAGFVARRSMVPAGDADPWHTSKVQCTLADVHCT